MVLPPKAAVASSTERLPHHPPSLQQPVCCRVRWVRHVTAVDRRCARRHQKVQQPTRAAQRARIHLPGHLTLTRPAHFHPKTALEVIPEREIRPEATVVDIRKVVEEMLRGVVRGVHIEAAALAVAPVRVLIEAEDIRLHLADKAIDVLLVRALRRGFAGATAPPAAHGNDVLSLERRAVRP